MADSIDSPWLTLVGLHEDGLQGLCPAAQQALAQAQTVFGAPRHLALAQVALQPNGRGKPWPVPFALDELLALRGRQQVLALVSGDPFWFGAGGSLAEHLAPHEWRSLGQSPTFSLVAAQLGWRLEHTDCLGLHASAHQQLLPLLAPGRQCIALLRDGAAALALAQWLQAEGWGASPYWVLQALGGPQARCRHWPAAQQAIAALQA
ncbi:SAM-dependent methyltransferase, partial [Vandammella animalimorsus]